MPSIVPDIRTIPRSLRLPLIEVEEVGDLYAGWREQAECRTYSVDSETPGDFSEDYDLEAIERARRVCQTPCAVAEYCLADALEDPKSHGVRASFVFVMGGLDEESRKLISRAYHTKSRPIPLAH